MMDTGISLRRAESDDDIARTKALFVEYADSLDFSLCFQGFDREMEEFPGAYAPPLGCLLIAYADQGAAGAVGLRPLESRGSTRRCEMKRLYVRPNYRKRGVGQQLVRRIITEAKEMGYLAMRLDTLPSMRSAREIYGAYGFVPVENYNDSPLDGIEHFELDLT